MDLKEVLRFLSKNKIILIAMTVIIAGIAVFYALAQPQQYEANMSVYIRREAEKPNDRYYTYDGYYSQQAAKEYTDTVVGLLKTTDISRRAVELSNLGVTPTDLSKMLGIKKVSPQVVSVSIRRADPAEASAAVSAVVNAVSERVGVFSAQGDSKFQVGAITTAPLVTKVPNYWYLFLIGGLLIGFGLGSLLSAIITYSRP